MQEGEARAVSERNDSLKPDGIVSTDKGLFCILWQRGLTTEERRLCPIGEPITVF
jgi:hypothetical protein